MIVRMLFKRVNSAMSGISKKVYMMSTIIFVTVCVVSFSTFGFIGLGFALIVMGAL